MNDDQALQGQDSEYEAPALRDIGSLGELTGGADEPTPVDLDN